MSDIQSSAHKTTGIVEHFFRHESAKVKSFLIKKFGTDYIDLAEDAVQEALIKAMQTWSYKGAPENPSAWIFQVSKNHMLDVLRKESSQVKKKVAWQSLSGSVETDQFTETSEELKDDRLKMMFLTCHPSLSMESQIVLTLKLVCGFGNNEVAHALLKKEDAVAKAFTRAKIKLKEENIIPEIPPAHELKARLSPVLNVLYLLFNEGYSASSGNDLIRENLCEEAILMSHLLLEHKDCVTPELYALISLMYFQASRLQARTDSEGNLLTLSQQDRSLWNQEMINIGFYYLSLAAQREGYTEYHIQAAIASCYSAAKDYYSINWKQILTLYDLLLEIHSDPISSLNRIVAYSNVYGPDCALKELQKIEKGKLLSEYYLLYAIKGELNKESGNMAEAKRCLSKAIELTQNDSERKFLMKKLNAFYTI